MSPRVPFSLLVLVAATTLAVAPLAWAQAEDEYGDEGYDDEEAAGDEAYDEQAVGDEAYDEEAAGDQYEDEAAVGEGEEGEEEREPPLVHSSLHGETGLFHVISADSGQNLTFAVGLHMNFFLISDWLNGAGVVTDAADENSFVGGTVHVRFTVWDYIEAYFAVTNYANANQTEEPQLFQTLGDMVLGVKGFYPVLPWLFIGGGVGVYFLNQVGDVAFAGGSTSAALRVAMTMDFQRLNRRVPVRLHINWEYFFDNSSKLVGEVERRRAGLEPADEDLNGCSFDRDGDGLPDDDAGCITRVERTALHISRLDTTWVRLGIEFPTRYIVPFIEYNFGIPVNRQDFNCVYRETEEGVGTSTSEFDSCVNVAGVSAMPMWLTLGARILPWVRGLAINLGVDIGLTGTRTFVHELPATPPYMVYLGLSYSYNPRQRVIERTHEVEVEVEPEAPPAAPVIAGTVVDAENQQPIARALVTFPGRDVTTLATGTDGRFLSWPLAEGPATVHVEHPDYNPADCTATLPATGQTELQCSMTPLPRRGTLAGRVTDEDGGAVAGARVIVTRTGGGTGSVTVTTGSDGRFEREVEAGTYNVQVEAEGFLRRGGESVEIRVRERTEMSIQLRRQPRTALVRIQGDQIRILRAVHFRTNSAEIDPDSYALLEQVADVMLRNPDMCHIEIQGHTDSSGTLQRNMTLSQERADSVMNYLVETGVSRDRLSARGFGPEVPVAPNITAAGRSRNRRVEFHITERCSGSGAATTPAPSALPTTPARPR